MYIACIMQIDLHFMKKIPPGAEASNILVGELEFLEKPVVAFVRLSPAVLLNGLAEVPITTRCESGRALYLLIYIDLCLSSFLMSRHTLFCFDLLCCVYHMCVCLVLDFCLYCWGQWEKGLSTTRSDAPLLH